MHDCSSYYYFIFLMIFRQHLDRLFGVLHIFYFRGKSNRRSKFPEGQTKTTPWKQDVNWTYIRRSEDVRTFNLRPVSTGYYYIFLIKGVFIKNH